VEKEVDTEPLTNLNEHIENIRKACLIQRIEEPEGANDKL